MYAPSVGSLCIGRTVWARAELLRFARGSLAWRWHPAPPAMAVGEAPAGGDELSLLAAAAATARRAESQPGSPDGVARTEADDRGRNRHPSDRTKPSKPQEDPELHDEYHDFGSTSTNDEFEDDDDDDEENATASPTGMDHEATNLGVADGPAHSGHAHSAGAGPNAGNRHNVRHRRPNTAADPMTQDFVPSSLARVERIRHRFQGRLQRRAMSSLHQLYGRTSQSLTTLRETVTLMQVRLAPM